MANEVCTNCSHILQRRAVQYFSDILLSVSTADVGEELDDLKRAHELIVKLNMVVPDLLMNVLPLVEEEMKFDQLNVRQIATETMAKLFAYPDTNIAEKYLSIWKTWVGRRNDKNVQLRTKWLEMCVEIYKNHPELANEIGEYIKVKLADPDEKVRLVACKVIGEIFLDNDIKHLDKSTLELVSERAKDKKVKLNIQANDKTSIQKIGWIPQSLLNCVYTDDAAVLINLEETLLNYIFPYNEDDQQRTDRLITVFEALEDRQKLAFTAILNDTSLSDHISDNDSHIKYLAAHFVDKPRTLNAMRTFLNRKSNRDIKLLRTSISVDGTYKKIFKAKKTLLSHLNEDQAGSVEVFQAILNRACPTLLNKNLIPSLSKAAKQSEGRRQALLSQKATIAQEMLKEIAVSYPTMYEGFVKDLTQEISNNGNVETLEILAEVSKSKSTKLKYDREMINELRTCVVEGNISQARSAATVLSNMKDADVMYADLVDGLCDGLKLNKNNLLSTLTSLSEFASYAPSLITSVIDLVADFIEKNLLTARTKTFSSSNPEWVVYDSLPDLSKQKMVGVQLLVNYLEACKNTSSPDEHTVAKVFSILWDLLERTCDDASEDDTNAAETSHLRLRASEAIVKLTQHSKYVNELTIPRYERLSYTLQDTCYYVRSEFAEFLMKGLQTEVIHSRYYALLFVCAHEPEAALVKQIGSFVQRRLALFSSKPGGTALWGTSLVRLIHMLAHHPDFTVALEDLAIFAQYIRFFLRCVATVDNVSFLYHVAQKIKLSKDMVSEELSHNSYLLSDMTSMLIKTRCKESSWALNAYTGRVSLLSKLYGNLPAGSVQNEAMTKNYLPEAFIEMMGDEGKVAKKY
ncbi:armadillo-type protein [Sporodiniella umbellata]|nr:armadillo-type protein [Sporodiniella umbellata]